MTTQRFKDKYRIESTRLQNYDYSANGWYFVTICTRDKLCFFGDAIAGQIQLSEIGEIAQKFWEEIPSHFKHTYLDAYVIMPNHVHGIIVIDRPASGKNVNVCRDVTCNVSTSQTNITTSDNFNDCDISRAMSEISPKAGSLSVILRSYKSAVKRWCTMNSHTSFAWQAGFHDSIIRSDASVNWVRQYIINNPARWELDKNNAENLWM
jgi:putative transposase